MQSLVDGCQARGIPVVQVFHRERTDDPATLLGGLGLRARDAGTVAAYRRGVLQARALGHVRHAADGTTLESWLRAHGIGELLITGIRTEQCCETTTRHASDLGFGVRYVTDATLTFPMRTRSWT